MYNFYEEEMRYECMAEFDDYDYEDYDDLSDYEDYCDYTFDDSDVPF